MPARQVRLSTPSFLSRERESHCLTPDQAAGTAWQWALDTERRHIKSIRLYPAASKIEYIRERPCPAALDLALPV
jgi:hypothetical protein